jgi:hypothetical protein
MYEPSTLDEPYFTSIGHFLVVAYKDTKLVNINVRGDCILGQEGGYGDVSVGIGDGKD